MKTFKKLIALGMILLAGGFLLQSCTDEAEKIYFEQKADTYYESQINGPTETTLRTGDEEKEARHFEKPWERTE